MSHEDNIATFAHAGSLGDGGELELTDILEYLERCDDEPTTHVDQSSATPQHVVGAIHVGAIPVTTTCGQHDTTKAPMPLPMPATTTSSTMPVSMPMPATPTSLSSGFPNYQPMPVVTTYGQPHTTTAPPMPPAPPTTIEFASSSTLTMSSSLLSSGVPGGVPCHQPPWQFGCAGMGQPKSGADDKGARYCYVCECGRKWNQLRPEKIGADGNPHIRESKRAITDADQVRCNGYSCKICNLKLNKTRAMELGQFHCVCSKEARKMAAKIRLPRRSLSVYQSTPPPMPSMPSTAATPVRKVVMASAVQPVAEQAPPVVVATPSPEVSPSEVTFKRKKMRMISRK